MLRRPPRSPLFPSPTLFRSSLQTLAFVCLGGALGAGGANAINHFLDQDIDAMMSRTAKRPVASHRVQPISALAFGISLNIGSFLVLTYWVNLLSACLTLAATLFYVLVYTGWLKRNTPQNIVIGGAAEIGRASCRERV